MVEFPLVLLLLVGSVGFMAGYLTGKK